MVAAKDRMRSLVIVNFDKYNPPQKAVNKEVRDGAALKWLRWEVTSHRDQDILDMPVGQRFLWVALCCLAGGRSRDKEGFRVVRMTAQQIAREAEMPVRDVEEGLKHLRNRGRIRYVRGGGRVAAATKQGGKAPPNRHQLGGHVPTDLRTDVPTGGADRSRGQDDGRAKFDLVGKAEEIAKRQGKTLEEIAS